ncbi:uncharacterized protein LOC110595636 [Carlito syrichta]|uniref:Uncharacterized protein LOC110595636 n=1 Tax=Carlito syrichta TaxID=1868482 RepID=A0A3Q0DZH7_CARSF|nr:uncharacterized protein LOC110595636 [Carlito syrichta]
MNLVADVEQQGAGKFGVLSRATEVCVVNSMLGSHQKELTDPHLGGGVSPNTSSLPPGSWGGSGLLSSSSGRSSSPRAERWWPPDSAGKRRLGEREALGRSGRGRRQDGGSVEWSRSQRGRISSPAQLPYSLAGPAPSAREVEEACASGLAAAAGERGGHSGVTGQPRPLSGTYAATAAHCLSPSTRGANRKRAAWPSDGRASGPMSTADGERGGE